MHLTSTKFLLATMGGILAAGLVLPQAASAASAAPEVSASALEINYRPYVDKLDQHTVTVSLVSVHVYDDGDKGANPGDFANLNPAFLIQDQPGFSVNRGSKWNYGGQQHYYSDHDYTYPVYYEGVNKKTVPAGVGATLKIYASMLERDSWLAGPSGGVWATGSRTVTVPKAGTHTDYTLMIEGTDGPFDHVRMNFTIRLTSH
ncbi:hypothetical protein D1871_13595 [Nakamurella silvestris]|nr:hypothetical protein D1871_13595 [Nakamurella silvestris]